MGRNIDSSMTHATVSRVDQGDDSQTWFLPTAGLLSRTDARRWYANVHLELASGMLDDGGGAKVREYYREAGLLTRWRLPFFWRHYADTLSEAVSHLLRGRSQPRILDLGCGSGSQSLLFALLGADVVSVDMDHEGLEVLRRRINHYGKLSGRDLRITIVEGDTIEMDYSRLGPFDGVYSLFAFNMMQPSQRLLDRLAPHCAPGARWVVLDGNRESIWNRAIPGRRRRVWSAAEMKRALEGAGFRVTSQTGGVAVPPPLWALLPWRWALGLDRALCGGSFWPISVQTMAIRGTEGAS